MGHRSGPVAPVSLALLLLWSVAFGFGLDRDAANFWPTSERMWIIAAMLAGTLPYMIADAVLTRHASFFRRLMVRGGFLMSLGLAVALDPEELFFLIIIAPVIVDFYLLFRTVGRQAGRRSGPLASGMVLGLVLAWALGVSFPLLDAG